MAAATTSSLFFPALLSVSRLGVSLSDPRRTPGFPGSASELPRHKWPVNLLLLSSRICGLSRCHKTRYRVPHAINLTAGDSDGPGKLHLDGIVNELRKIWDGLPQPVKNFPWTKTLMKFCQLIVELTLAVAKYLSIPLLAVSSLSEMSYCAHERKMTLIPIPFLAGFAVSEVLKDTAVELSPDIKEGGFPGHLLLIAVFFLLLKLPGPHYPYWGRLIIPHFANGGLWRTIWSTILWYRLSKGARGTRQGGSPSENPTEENK